MSTLPQWRGRRLRNQLERSDAGAKSTMTDFHEIVDLNQFAFAMRVVAIIVPVVALIGLIVGKMRGGAKDGLARAVAVGLLGPLIYGLWLMYSYLIRYDPQTGYVGLHRVSVMLLNVAIFAAIGVVLGLVYRRVFRATPATDASAEAIAHPD